MKTKTIKVCNRCETELIQANNREELPFFYWKWYNDKNFFKKNVVHYCPKCKTVYLSSRELEFMLAQIWGFLKNLLGEFKI